MALIVNNERVNNIRIGEDKIYKLRIGEDVIFTADTIGAYGIDIDTETGTVTRIGDIRGHRQLPVQNSMIGGTITADGTFTPFPNQSDWTAAENQSRDGSAGNCVVKIPLHYVKYETVGTHIRAWVSHLWHQGFSVVGDYYVGAHEATINRDTGALADVVSMDAKYRGGNNHSSWDGTYRTLLGKPATEISLTNFRNAARLINNGDTRHNIIPYYKYKDFVWLIYIEYANLNSQADFNPNLDANGFHQGGLGAGVTNWNNAGWNDYNNRQPFIPCGVTDTLGNGTGVISYMIKDSGGSDLKTFSVPRYRGIENPFGYIWEWTDGVLVDVVSGTDGTSAVYACSNPSLFSSTSYSNYRFVGNELRSWSYVKEIHFGEYGDITAKIGGGNGSSYYCDYHYTNTGSTSLRAVQWGGCVNDGAWCGFACSATHNTPTGTDIVIGSRYCYIP